MCPGGERWDRAHSVQSLRGEWTVLLPRLLPRCTWRGCPQQHQADRDLIGSSHQQEDLQEDGQDPETTVCAVILSTNQLANIPVEDG